MRPTSGGPLPCAGRGRAGAGVLGGYSSAGPKPAIFRSGSRGLQPIIARITPSDAMNLALKSSSALAQGAEHVIAPGVIRKTRVALLYSISADLRQPWG